MLTRTICFVAIASFTTLGFGQDDAEYKSIRGKLDGAQMRFNSNVNDAAQKLVQTLQAKIEFAQKRGLLDLLKQAESELDAFKQTGALPTLVKSGTYQSVLERERGLLSNAYQIAIRDFLRAGLRDDAEQTDKMFQTWKFPFSEGLDLFANGSELIGFRTLGDGKIRHELTLVVTERRDGDFQGRLLLYHARSRH